MASVRVTGAKRLPDAVFAGTAKALVVGLVPSKHVLDNGHMCGRAALEMKFAPDSQARVAFENFEFLDLTEKEMVLRAESVAWTQLREIRALQSEKSRAN